MASMTNTFLFAMLSLLSFPARADHPYPMPAHTIVEIASYEPETRTYTVYSRAHGCADSHTTTAEELSKGIRAIHLKRVLRQPRSIVGNQYQADREFTLLAPSQIEARRRTKKTNGARLSARR